MSKSFANWRGSGAKAYWHDQPQSACVWPETSTCCWAVCQVFESCKWCPRVGHVYSSTSNEPCYARCVTTTKIRLFVSFKRLNDYLTKGQRVWHRHSDITRRQWSVSCQLLRVIACNKGLMFRIRTARARCAIIADEPEIVAPSFYERRSYLAERISAGEHVQCSDKKFKCNICLVNWCVLEEDFF